MKRTFRTLRSMAAIAIVLGLALNFTGCKKDETTPDPETPETPTGEAVYLTSPITENTTLKDLGLAIDYIWDGNALEVENDAILTIEPGVTIQFTKKDGRLVIQDGATIKAIGIADKHIRFIGTGTEKGSWKDITIYTTTDNELSYVEILNAGGDGYDESSSLKLDKGKVALTNSLISNSKTNGITLRAESETQTAELTAFTGNTISNCDMAPVYTCYYIGCYGLRNISNDNPFEDWTGNQNPYIHISEDLNTQLLSMTLKSIKSYPWYFEDGLTIEGGIDFTVEPGAVVMVGAKEYFRADTDSHLVAKGTPEMPITFKGFRATQGYWSGFEVHSLSPGTVFDYCNISDGGLSNYLGAIYYSTNSFVEIYNTHISNILFSAVVCAYSSADFNTHYNAYLKHANVTFDNIGGSIFFIKKPVEMGFGAMPEMPATGWWSFF